MKRLGEGHLWASLALRQAHEIKRPELKSHIRDNFQRVPNPSSPYALSGVVFPASRWQLLGRLLNAWLGQVLALVPSGRVQDSGLGTR